MRAQARAQLTQHVYTCGIVRLPSLALAVSTAAALAAGLAVLRLRCPGWPGAWARLALAVLFPRPRWLPRRSALLALLPACPSLALLAALLGPSCRLPYIHTAGGLRGLKNGASWLRLAGLAYHTAAAWRLPLLRLPWRYKDSASGFLGWLPALPSVRSWLAALPGLCAALEEGRRPGWLAGLWTVQRTWLALT